MKIDYKNKQIDKALKGKSGKDLLRLIESKEKHSQNPDRETPSGEIEIVLFDFWKNVLGHDNFGVTDDFFRIGGNSIKSIHLISKISRHFAIHIEITDIFLNTTISQIAQLVSDRLKSNILPSQIEIQTRPEFIPLSFSQERLWFIDQLDGSLPYHVSAVLRLKGTLDIAALEHSIQTVINRHEVLRTVIKEEKGQAFQYIKEKDNWKLENIDGSILKKDENNLQERIQQLINEPFDLSKDNMLRAALITLSRKEHLLVLTMHHISSDAWSLSILIEEVSGFYESYKEDKLPELPRSEIQYADFAVWQRNYLTDKVLEEKLGYWKKKLYEVPALQLPTDFNRPFVTTSKGAVTGFRIEKKLYGELNDLSRLNGATLYMTLLAVFNVLLYRYSGQNDISVGTSIANRSLQQIEKLIGFFVNTLALRNEVNSNESFTELLQQVKNTILEAFEHQDIPFEKVVDAVVKERNPGRSPLFQVMLVLNNVPDVSQFRLGEVKLSKESFAQHSSKFEITIFITETSEGIEGSVEYSTDLYKDETIRNMMLHFKELLKSAVKSPEEKIGVLQMLTKEEQQRFSNEINCSSVIYPEDKSVVDLFEEQVGKTPEASALVFENKKLTYRELNEHSNQLAHYLRSKGVKEETLVPLYIERGFDMMIGILGILKSGAAYVPFDTDLPKDRIAYMLDDTKSSVVICSKESKAKLSHIENINIVEIGDAANEPKDDLQIKVLPYRLAYVIYTSGSTGKPKGVMIEHRSLADYVYGLNEKIKINESSSFALVSSIATDLGNTVIYSSLLSGGALHLFSKESVSNIEYLHKYFAENTIDCLKIVPSHWKALIQAPEERLLLPKKLLIFGGEALKTELLDKIRLSCSDCVVVNHYGPTETTIGKLLHVTDAEKIKYGNTIPVGKPFSNTKIYVLSKDMELCPAGIPGQLYISGDGTARGYFNNEELTKEKFVKNPFVKVKDKGKAKDNNSLMYATGDLVKYLPDGNILFIGRVDDQVKIRGYRIELGEIENALNQDEFVNQAVVLAREDKNGNKRLIGYIVPEKDLSKEFSKEEITNRLKEKLPEYMIPSLLIEMESFPLTANGKTDRNALPDPDAEEMQSGQYAAPRNEAETVLAEIWQELLDIESVGIHDNFFELGGDSIITIQLVSRARRSGYELQVGDVFTYQTIARLSALLDQRADKLCNVTGEQFILTGSCGLLPIQQWYLEKEHQDISHFNQSVLLGIDKNITEPVLKRAIEQLKAQHDALRFKYFKKDGQWHQSYEPESEVSGVIKEDLQTSSEDLLNDLIKQNAERYQRSLDIEKGELIKVVWMQTPEIETHNRLLIVIHHLAIDGVSWRILLEDLELLITGLKEGGKTDLGPKSSSYRQWYEALENYGKTEELLSQKSYWENAVKNQISLPTDTNNNKLTSEIKAKDTEHEVMHLDSEQTHRLIQEVPKVYHTEINDILISALAKTLSQWSGNDKVTIGMEGHGRQQINEETDTSRTVGWFTSHYPVMLEVNQSKGEDDLIKSVKEQLRKVPDKGLGFGVLKYINKEETLQGKESPDIIFNYLGQSDNVLNRSQWFKAVEESSGKSISDDYIFSNKLSVNGIVQSGELILNWTYSKKHYEKETIEKLIQKYQDNLESLIGHCTELAKSGTVHTPSDYGLGADISYEELDEFLQSDEKDNTIIF